MKRFLITFLAATVVGLFGTQSVSAQSFDDIAGKWTLKKKNSWGEVQQQLELKDSQFSYRETNPQGATLLVAKGKVKVERMGVFNVMRLMDIRGGYSEGEMEPAGDDRVVIFVKGWNTLTVALNLDQYHEGESPKLDTYRKSTE